MRSELIFAAVATAALAVFVTLFHYDVWWSPWVAMIVFGALAVVVPRSGGPMDDVAPPLGIVMILVGLGCLAYVLLTG